MVEFFRARNRYLLLASRAVSGIYQGAVGPRAVVAINVPVTNDDGKVAYVLSLNPSLGVFANVVRRQSMPASWFMGLVDRRGVLISRVPDGGYVGQKAAPTILGPLQKRAGGHHQFTSLEGIPLLTVFSHRGQSGWAIAIGVPKSELTGPAFWMATSNPRDRRRTARGQPGSGGLRRATHRRANQVATSPLGRDRSRCAARAHADRAARGG